MAIEHGVVNGVVVEALVVGIGVVGKNVNVSTAVMTALKFPIPLRYVEFSC